MKVFTTEKIYGVVSDNIDDKTIFFFSRKEAVEYRIRLQAIRHITEAQLVTEIKEY